MLNEFNVNSQTSMEGYSILADKVKNGYSDIKEYVQRHGASLSLISLALGITGCATVAEAASQSVPTEMRQVITGSVNNPTLLSEVGVEAWLQTDENCAQEGLEVHLEDVDNPVASAEYCVPGMPALDGDRASTYVFDTDNGRVTLFDSSREPGQSPMSGGMEATAVIAPNQ